MALQQNMRVASSLQQSKGPLRAIELRRLTDDKFDACAHEWNWCSNPPLTILRANLKLANVRYTDVIDSVREHKLYKGLPKSQLKDDALNLQIWKVFPIFRDQRPVLKD